MKSAIDRFPPKYSICITTKNNLPTLADSLGSIFREMTLEFELVIVDGESNDGSYKILEEYARRPDMKLIRKQSSRGAGRQLAFEASTGEFIISNIDLDDEYPVGTLKSILSYEAAAKKKVVMLSDKPERKHAHGITFASRQVINEVGGWRDLNYWEDFELWRRAAKQGLYSWAHVPLRIQRGDHPERRTLIGKFQGRYAAYVGRIRIGIPVFRTGERVNLGQRMTFILAKISSGFRTSYRDQAMLGFNPYADSYRMGA